LRLRTPTLFPYTTLFRSGHAPASLLQLKNFCQSPELPRGFERDWLSLRIRSPAPARQCRSNYSHALRRTSPTARTTGSGLSNPRSEEHTSELQSLAYLVC